MRNREAGQVGNILAHGQLADDMHARQRLISVDLPLILIEPSLEVLRIGGRPPVDQIAVQVELGPLVVELVAHLMADDRADPTIVYRRVSVGVEERRLQDRGREYDLDHRRI